MSAASRARERVKAARREATRQVLLDAAERTFAEHGYAVTRMKDIARHAGVALATLYELTPGKRDLYEEVLELRGEGLLQRAASAAANATSAADALRRAVGAYIEYLCEHPDYLRIQLLEQQPWALASRFETETQRSQWTRGLELSVQVFKAAIAEGSVVDEDPDTLARLMIASHQVFLGRWIETGMKEPVSSLVARIQAHILRSFGP